MARYGVESEENALEYLPLGTYYEVISNADHSPLRSSQMRADTALERASAELSNAALTSA